MSFLVSFTDVDLAFGDQKILVSANLQIVERERVCLIGRNGAGKSSTLKLVTSTGMGTCTPCSMNCISVRTGVQ